MPSCGAGLDVRRPDANAQMRMTWKMYADGHWDGDMEQFLQMELSRFIDFSTAELFLGPRDDEKDLEEIERLVCKLGLGDSRQLLAAKVAEAGCPVGVLKFLRALNAPRTFDVGLIVRIDGLRNRPEFNGRLAWTVGFREETGRWCVRLVSDRRIGGIAVLPANLLPFVPSVEFGRGLPNPIQRRSGEGYSCFSAQVSCNISLGIFAGQNGLGSGLKGNEVLEAYFEMGQYGQRMDQIAMRFDGLRELMAARDELIGLCVDLTASDDSRLDEFRTMVAERTGSLHGLTDHLYTLLYVTRRSGLMPIGARDLGDCAGFLAGDGTCDSGEVWAQTGDGGMYKFFDNESRKGWLECASVMNLEEEVCNRACNRFTFPADTP